MEVIEKMPDDQYDSICNAGVDLVNVLFEVLGRHGIPSSQAFNVMAVAAAGVVRASGLTASHLGQGIESVIHMWRIEDVDGCRQAVFDPPHLRPGFVAVVPDPMSGN